MFVETGDVTYSLKKLRNRGCDAPNCDTRYSYGVQVKVTKKKKLLGKITISRDVEKNAYCPVHREEHELSEKARKKEHEKARVEWQNVKKERNESALEEIIDRDILPSFRYHRGTVLMDDWEKFYLNVDSYDDAVSFFEQSRNNDPILLYKTDRRGNYKYSIIEPGRYNGSRTEDVTHNSDIELEEFQEEYGDTQFVTRDYYIVKTNELTGVSTNEPVHKLNDIVDEIVEWKEYDSEHSRVKLSRCPLCERNVRRGNKVSITRAIIDGEERLILMHLSCQQIVGEINPSLVEEEKYEIIQR